MSSALANESTLRHRKALEKAPESLEPGPHEEEAERVSKTKSTNYLKYLRQIEAVVSPIVITLLSLHIRFKDIGLANSVVWDEAHFGKFGSQYLKHTFYHDVHPVLGKMLVGFSGYLAGYNGSFPFESSKKYPADLDYVTMRKFNCLFSVFTPTVAYYTSKSLGFNWLTTALISVMCIYETSFVVLSKFILLDSMLLFFTATTFFTLVKFYNVNRELADFSYKWYKWLILSGISIGCVCSVKWVGLFVMAVYGLYVVMDLLTKYYTVNLTRSRYYLHWAVRAVTLIALPFLIYVLCFYVHFSLLYKSGDGSKSTSTLFQMNLQDHDIELSHRNVYFGSKISLRSQGLSPNLLHSHGSTYPEGSGQQQITTYDYKDDNNDWIVHYPRYHSKQIDEQTYAELPEVEKVVDGTILRLSHVLTQGNLHSHAIPGHVTTSAFEVSGYGNHEIGDDKDDWVVEITEQLHSANDTYLRLYESNPEFSTDVHPVSTSFRLRHKVLGCYLATTGLSYPKWGFTQGEVVCKNSWSWRDKSTWWNIEDHHNAHHNASEVELEWQLPKSHFWRDFILINFAMALTNNALVPDLDKEDKLASSAWEWPLVHVGLRMCGWSASDVRYFLMALPFTTWTSTLSLVVFLVLTVFKLLQYQRQALQWGESEFWYYTMGGVFPFIAWVLHYLPFVVMSRVTYVHHYLPALYFAIFVEGFLFDYMSRSLVRGKKSRVLMVVVYVTMISLVGVCFWYFSPVCLGMTGRKNDYRYLQWFKNWTMV